MTRLGGAFVACLLATWPAPGLAQDYRVVLDASAQAVSFRGLTRDSIALALAVPDANGGLVTPDGYAVRCGANGYCLYFRPGPALRGMPVTTSASIVLWGFGVEGLAFHASGRLVADAGRDRVWPGTTPAGRFLEGYFELQRSAFRVRAGRQLVASRLEPIGFDGALVKLHWDRASLDITGYGGWGLGQAAALTATSPALNPLDEWRPRNRQLVSGGEAAWLYRSVDLRAEYRREIDPQDNYFVSERAALSLGARLAGVRATGGFDYNMAEGRMGSADVGLTYSYSHLTMSGGARRYQPYFSLWTLWGAFSPVAYNAANASLQLQAANWLALRARGERYRYDDADVSVGLVPTLRDRGWRASASATATVSPRWTLEGSYSLERGPGASGRFADGSVTYTPREALSFDVYGGTMARPLELRYYDATSRWIGSRASWQRTAQQRIWTDMALVSDDRERPDAGSSSLHQLRLRAGVRLQLGSSADRTPLPPATRTGR